MQPYRPLSRSTEASDYPTMHLNCLGDMTEATASTRMTDTDPATRVRRRCSPRARTAGVWGGPPWAEQTAVTLESHHCWARAGGPR